jgi:hypothetical protein
MFAETPQGETLLCGVLPLTRGLLPAQCGGPREAISAERPVACFGDLQLFNFERLPPIAERALSGRGGEAGAHQLCQLIRREAMHAHDGFGAPSRAATSEERKRTAKIGRAANIGLWAARVV